MVKKSAAKTDMVNRPKHYVGKTGKEVINVIDELTFGPEYCIISAIQYLLRAHRKNGLEDLQKALWCLNRFKNKGFQAQLQELQHVPNEYVIVKEFDVPNREVQLAFIYLFHYLRHQNIVDYLNSSIKKLGAAISNPGHAYVRNYLKDGEN